MKRKITFAIACSVLLLAVFGCHRHTANKEQAVANEPAEMAISSNQPVVIAYYFHRTMRCPTCLAIEANAERVIQNEFSQQLADGLIMWMPLNLDGPGGKEFAKQYGISVSTLVLSKMDNGLPVESQKLEKVWEYIGNPAKFDTYVSSEIRAYLGE